MLAGLVAFSWIQGLGLDPKPNLGGGLWCLFGILPVFIVSLRQIEYGPYGDLTMILGNSIVCILKGYCRVDKDVPQARITTAAVTCTTALQKEAGCRRGTRCQRPSVFRV